jgi:DNA-directed RNA polymerase subunit M/transcription elongation factor TFIIS
MKVCNRCGQELTIVRDGENACQQCLDENKKKMSAVKRKAYRQAIDSIMRDCGLTKVRGSMGGVYWE